MTKVYTLDEILEVLPRIDVVGRIADGFKAYSSGRVNVPPVGELLFPDVEGELHIKYGAILGDSTFVIKIATGFYSNPALGLPPFGGCMLVLSQKTGSVEAILLEAGELTNHRTAAAGAVAALILAPPDVQCIGIVGAGVQARLQADYLRQVTPCRRLTLWARNPDKAKAAAADIADMGYDVHISDTIEKLCRSSRLIVTTTPSKSPLITSEMVIPGTHITAMGSDSADKNELAPELLAAADIVVADSIKQCLSSGELHHAVAAGTIDQRNIPELGTLVGNPDLGRQHGGQITIADLTGVAVQDIVIATAVLEELQA